MRDLHQSAQQLRSELSDAMSRLAIDESLKQKETIDARIVQPDFWDSPPEAQKIMKQQAKLAARVDPWISLRVLLDDAIELIELGDESLREELALKIDEAAASYEALKDTVKLAAPYDDYDVILNIYAGAGGTDAQDWASMLMRMYIRWAEKQGVSIQTIEESAGDEAGIKSVTFELSGSYVYGKLKSEHGVHRLVRLSPFNSDNLRQTSFAKVDILPRIESPEDLAIDEKDVRIDVYRAGGHGGQSVNTTDSAVRVTHIPTGISVAIQNERSQLQNKEVAMTILRSRLLQLQMEQHQERLDALKGPNQSAEWGNQIRSYVLHPYKQVKDVRTRFETSSVDAVLDGDIDAFIEAYLDYSLGETQ